MDINEENAINDALRNLIYNELTLCFNTLNTLEVRRIIKNNET